jgi:FKBP-type peptidyl-prolyl cis-trans isomerase
MNGTRFGDSRDRDETIEFRVAMGDVPAGWDEALRTMAPGDRRALIIPPNLAQGGRGVGLVIPSNETLFFEIERVR